MILKDHYPHLLLMRIKKMPDSLLRVTMTIFQKIKYKKVKSSHFIEKKNYFLKQIIFLKKKHKKICFNFNLNENYIFFFIKFFILG